ncbi:MULTISPECIES: DNA cytosine methyltransferase [Pseudomonas]|jgi:DNA (cytosine-5)-methyltransferase 1|uniref:DNA cytosine methyltransferase n=1 Tax=Pseudomonas TaxID=286 RepID=UPI000876B458|nr:MULTISPECIES: DNA cytosine methyltransferase [Pseudomonas]SCZ19794.1 DNA (cytosine-5)-methyltransferase 1 [Pseudomonas sp. NFIX46]SDB15469.1 DNA (cytosine-5)-methyltransferase 1 [Pseudomonas putida]SFQ63335.1 DNA (cytosine-5)-methyltransferase 1 [Pseudomonas sp. NFIX49]
MNTKQPLQVVDLFAGPGGLGEGFSSLNEGRSFQVIVSAEMDSNARSTLRLRAFYRALRERNPEALSDYYNYCESSEVSQPWSERSRAQWIEADNEARQIRLGSPEGNAELDYILEKKLDTSRPWVLIGGPPCQAYSIVGRARNKGNSEYKAEDDQRHFLYREYLRIIQSKRPAIFVMENVKGILSSQVGGKKIFPQILRDLADPDLALGIVGSNKPKYKICSLVSEDVYESGTDPLSLNLNNFVIKSEDYGIPQNRHRVILVGVSEEFSGQLNGFKLKAKSSPSVSQMIKGLPKLRSTLSRGGDTADLWCGEVISHLDDLYRTLVMKGVDPLLEKKIKIVRNSFAGARYTNGALRLSKGIESGQEFEDPSLEKWFNDKKLNVWLNHEARGHMTSDLKRYLYASIFADAHKASPKGHKEFNLPGLAPDHKNWETGKFSDRFRVQVRDKTSSTITSHISKDGHYFIHYDPHQCRSLTVREAARLQTFPDNYFFLGNRTQQFHQVGNAVPPLLAQQIAEVVERMVNGSPEQESKRVQDNFS